MITSKKMFITFSIVISLISCSEKDINNPDSENLESDNLDFVVYAKTDDNPYSLFQINVSELGEISESNLSTELGLRSENTASIPLPIHSTGNLFVFKEHQPPNKLHIKDLSTNIYTTINTLCDVSLDNILYNIKSTDNKFVLFFQTLDNSYSILTIDKNLDITNCQKLPLGKVLFAEPFDYFRYGSKHVIFKMYTEGSTHIYSLNTELNQLNSVVYNQLTDSPYSNIIMDKDKFLFVHGRNL